MKWRSFQINLKEISISKEFFTLSCKKSRKIKMMTFISLKTIILKVFSETLRKNSKKMKFFYNKDKSFEILIETNGNENKKESTKSEILSNFISQGEPKKETQEKSLLLDVLSFGELSFSISKNSE